MPKDSYLDKVFDLPQSLGLSSRIKGVHRVRRATFENLSSSVDPSNSIGTSGMNNISLSS